MQHKLYNLASQQTFLGIDLSDITVGLTTWLLGNFLAGEFLPPRLRLLAIFASIGLALTLWRVFKDKLPPGFFRHFLAWATEANAYRVGPDTKTRPAVVDHRRVLKFLEQEKRDRIQLSQMPSTAFSSGNAAVRPSLKHTLRLTPPPRPAYDEVAQDAYLTPRVGSGA